MAFSHGVYTEKVKMDNESPTNDKTVHRSKTKKRLCEHCDRLVSIRTYNAHKRMKTTVILGKRILNNVARVVFCLICFICKLKLWLFI